MTPRADAQRNRDALLEAGADLFSEHGLGLPFEEVARRAGLGKGTLYRHFATRDHLIAAMMQNRFDTLEREADELLETAEPLPAIEKWLRDWDRYPLRSRGLGARVGEALADEDSVLSTACLPMKQSFGRLIRRAQDAGLVHESVNVPELLTVVAALPEQFRNQDGSSPFLDTILRGLRA